MKLVSAIGLLTVALLSGCATTPQQPIQFSSAALGPDAGRIGVVMTKLPTVDTSLPGAGCLLCMAFAAAANSSLSDHSKTLSYEDLPKLKNEVAQLLLKKGAKAVVISEELDLEKLSSSSGDGANLAKKDFTPLLARYSVDKLVVIDVSLLGFERTYSAYVATSEPKGVFRGAGYLVNLKTNTYEWYQPVNVLKSANGAWDEAPKFPGLTNAYYQALELGQDELRNSFK